jgi:ribosome maturation protein Sdo1
MFGERAHVRLAHDEPAAMQRLERALQDAGVHVESIRPVQTSLEDVFIARLEKSA